MDLPTPVSMMSAVRADGDCRGPQPNPTLNSCRLFPVFPSACVSTRKSAQIAAVLFLFSWEPVAQYLFFPTPLSLSLSHLFHFLSVVLVFSLFIDFVFMCMLRSYHN